MAKPAKLDPKIRPGAGGHRFGPDLQCSECGRFWDAHQQNPHPCSSDEPEPLAIPAAEKKPEGDEARKDGELP